ncbi:MAG: T9SS type A sorting domain-containing protein [Chitinophagaceae bacterium]|nr:T9SS type A sorting domain-containing protein [Chitinophagaceae bacterium]
MKPTLSLAFLLCFFFQLFSAPVFSQCMMYPVSLQERVSHAETIVLGTVVQKETFLDSVSMQVYTLNKIEITAYLKNPQSVSAVYVITNGGVFQNRSTIVYPSLQLQQQNEYVLFLQPASSASENKQLRKTEPAAKQMIAYAGAQGALVKSMNQFADLFDRPKQNEEQLLSAIQQYTKTQALTPAGTFFRARPIPEQLAPGAIHAITSFTPSTTRSGTIVAGDQITISGSGFGAAPGTVFFTNADDGGATFASSGVASDIVSWSDNTITVKVPSFAGTGPINVNGTMTSATNLTVEYAHTEINSSFSGFGSPTRQRYYLRNLNSLGGYTFEFNTTFASNTAAVSAFNRAVVSWRCGTGVNFRANGTTAIATSANDGTNCVYFNPSIPSGTLAVCTSNFLASANGSCNLQNTVWWLNDMDIQFRDVPTAGTTWEYGPSAPSASEYDFESVALHEIGHGHGFGHVIAPGQVMHYSIANGVQSRTPATNDLAAGTSKMSYSTAATCFNPPGSGTPMTAVSAGACVTLPITMGEVKARRINKTTNEISWSTIQELNNDGFTLERGETTQSFKPLVFIKGKELSLSPQSYLYNDETAGPYDWYYRLIQRDLNGQQVSSPIVFVKGEDSKQWKVWNTDGGAVINVYNKESVNRSVQFVLYNQSGQIMFSSTVTTGRGQFNVGHLPKGIYSYNITDAQQTIAGKLIITQ